jgi:hypothetical protein
MTAAQMARILTPGSSLQDLTDFASFMDAKGEDEFFAEVRRINPTLCPDW